MKTLLRTDTSCALEIIALMIYLGYGFGVFFSIAPANWYVPTNPLHWLFASLMQAIGGIGMIVFFGPYALIIPVVLFFVFRLRPKRNRNQLALLLPMIPILFLPSWAGYVSLYKPHISEWGAYQDSWEMHILDATSDVIRVSIIIVALFVLVFPRWKKQRCFALLILLIQGFVALLLGTGASWTVSNTWL